MSSDQKAVREGYKQTEVGVIPEDWRIVEISQVSKIIDSLHATPEFTQYGYSMVRVSDIKTGNLDLNTTFKVSKKTYSLFTGSYSPKKGDIVLSRVGSYGVSSYVNTSIPFCMGQNTVVTQVSEFILAKNNL